MTASEKNNIWRLTVCGEFCSAHALRNYQGKCENLHGHNFAVEVVVQGNRLDPQTEILLDFKILKKMLREILDNLDHHVLNDLEAFSLRNPSSENIAMHIWEGMEKALGEEPQAAYTQLYSVRVSEKEGQSATYCRA